MTKEDARKFLKQYRIYVVVTVLFIAWMFVGDEYNFMKVRKDKQKYKELEKEKVYYQNKLKDDRKQLNALKNDPEELEKIAREHYKMKRENEDVFLIVEEEKN